MRRTLLIGAAGLVLAALLVTYFLWWAPGPRPGPHELVIKEGTTLGSASRQLAKEGAIPGTAKTFYVMARLFGSRDPIRPVNSGSSEEWAVRQFSTCSSTASPCSG